MKAPHKNVLRVLSSEDKQSVAPKKADKPARRRYEHFQSRAYANAYAAKLLMEGKFDVRIYKDPANNTRYELSYMEYYTPKRNDY